MGAFGVLAGSLAVAAKLTGRPVKWSGTRSEVFLADEQARDVASYGELANSGAVHGLN